MKSIICEQYFVIASVKILITSQELLTWVTPVEMNHGDKAFGTVSCCAHICVRLSLLRAGRIF